MNEFLTQELQNEKYADLNSHINDDNIMLLVAGGSTMFGTTTDTSDIDIYGISTRSVSEILLGESIQKEEAIKGASLQTFTSFYKKLVDGSPLELCDLFIDDGLVIKADDRARYLISNRNAFISKNVIDYFRAYSISRLGENFIEGKGLENLSFLYRSRAAEVQKIAQNLNTMFADRGEIAFYYNTHETNWSDTNTALLVDVNVQGAPALELYRAVGNAARVDIRNSELSAKDLPKRMVRSVISLVWLNEILQNGSFNPTQEQHAELFRNIRDGQYITEDGKISDAFWDIYDDLMDDSISLERTTDIPNAPNEETVRNIATSILYDIVSKNSNYISHKFN